MLSYCIFYLGFIIIGSHVLSSWTAYLGWPYRIPYSSPSVHYIFEIFCTISNFISPIFYYLYSLHESPHYKSITGLLASTHSPTWTQKATSLKLGSTFSFIYVSVDGCVNWFYILDTINIAVMNMIDKFSLIRWQVHKVFAQECLLCIYFLWD